MLTGACKTNNKTYTGMKTEVSTRNKLIKKYHVLVGKLKMSDDDKLTLLRQWGVESSKDMSDAQLIQLCKLLESFSTVEETELQKWQKWTRQMVQSAARSVGMNYNDAYAEAILCRATGCKSFQSIPKHRLIAMYNQFKKAKADSGAVKSLIIEDIQGLARLN